MAWQKTACRKTDCINYPQRVGTASKAWGGMLPTSQETCLDPSWPASRYISTPAKFSWRLVSTCFPASPVESGSVRVTSGGVAYVTLDFVEDFGSLRSLFWSWRPWPPSCSDCSYCLAGNPRRSVSTLLVGTPSGGSLREPNSPFQIVFAQASASPTCHISHWCLLPVARMYYPMLTPLGWVAGVRT